MCSVQQDFSIPVCANRVILCQGVPPNLKLSQKNEETGAHPKERFSLPTEKQKPQIDFLRFLCYN